MTTTEYTVGKVAELAGVTVRTLHHYEQIGLLEPEQRSPSGYRQYSPADLDRLHHILYYRELGLALPDIATILDDPNTDSGSHLRRHRELLQQRHDRLGNMIAAIDKELEAYTMGTDLTPEEKLEIFGPDYDPSWEQEAQERWGDTDAWKVSAQRTPTFSKDQWKKIKADGDALMAKFGDAKRRGVAPDSDEAMALAEEHRHSIEVFYPCSHAQQRGLADMYLADERFSKTYDDVEPGLAQWVHDAVYANADRVGAPQNSAAAWQRDDS
ncbi:MerR family transcriptional regulator [Nakamurella lactea]|uniref:MerR family transcriptional regulator n=1 Tax=Nakamurella lactea TaxID=459515 RepID=UPI0003FAC861|nr:MerR family transcriptional regulator [Nakamurella lactea]